LKNNITYLKLFAGLLIISFPLSYINEVNKQTDYTFENLNLEPERILFKIKRGVNITHWLSQTELRGEQRRNRFDQKDIKLIASLGFDHIRIAVSDEQLWDEQGKGDEEAFQLLNNALDWCQKYRLKAIIDLHTIRSHAQRAGENILWRSLDAQEQFINFWKELSRRFHDRPVNQVAYELLNEPNPVDPEDWNRLIKRTVAALRELEPDRVLIIGSNSQSTPFGFEHLRIPGDDKNLILTFHFYVPILLVHYKKAGSPTGDYTGPIKYPGIVIEEDDLHAFSGELVNAIRFRNGYFDRSILEERLKRPLAFAKNTNLSLYCAEWGCSPAVPRPDLIRWYSDVKHILEKYGIPWTIWDYKGRFGIVDKNRIPIQDLIDTVLR